MNETIKNRISNYPLELDAIKHQCLKYIANNSKIGSGDELFIFHRPWIAPMNWGILLFPPVTNDWIQTFESRSDKAIPSFYVDFLNEINGCFIYDIALYGITSSIVNAHQTNKSSVRAQDLFRANLSWIQEYQVEYSFFHFGTSHYSGKEKLGYFADGNNEIFSMLQNGTVISTWKNFADFLQDEIARSEEKMKFEIPPTYKIKMEY